MWREFKFHEILTRITGTLHEDPRTFMIESRWILLPFCVNIYRACCCSDTALPLYSPGDHFESPPG